MARSKATCGCEACKVHPRSAEATEHRKVCRAIAGLDEKHARRVVGLLASMKGHGGTTLFSVITGMSRTTITKDNENWSDPIRFPAVVCDVRVADDSRSKKKPALDHTAAQGT
jgi:hypothetical protein